jgi:glycosyltransferase involved in cell wall biosynthesis
MNKLLLLCDTEFGGAGIACSRLAEGLAKSKTFEVARLVAISGSQAGLVYADAWPSLMNIARYRLQMAFAKSERGKRVAMERYHETNVMRCLKSWSPTLINVHNLHEAMSFSLLERIPQHIPLIWTLHDMWALTGYCYYSKQCKKYRTGCSGECPELGNWGAVTVPPDKEWQRRSDWFESRSMNLVCVAPSKWLADCAEARLNGRAKVVCIPNGLDTQIFTPLANRNIARNALGIPLDLPVILVGAHSFTPVKGSALLSLALDKLVDMIGRHFVVVVCGGHGQGVRVAGDAIYSGLVRDVRLLNMYYNAADVFVSSSLAENLPNVLVEACAAGTPSVAFDVGGCGEIVRDGENGFLAKSGDSSDLARCIAGVLGMVPARRQEMRLNCRRIAEAEYGLDRMVSRYESLGVMMLSRQSQGDSLSA